MIKRYFIALWILLLLTFGVRAQDQRVIDSLTAHLQENLHDTDRVNTLNILAQESFASDIDKVLIYARQSAELAEKLGYKNGQVLSYDNLARYYWTISNYSKSLDYLSKRMNIYKILNDLSGIASTYNNMGILQMNLSNYDEALKCYFESIRIEEEQCRKLEQESDLTELQQRKVGIAKSYNNVGNVYVNQGNYPDALDFFFKSIKIKYDLINSASDEVSKRAKSGIAATSNSIGNIYYKQANHYLALKYYLESHEIYKEFENNLGMAKTYSNIAIIYENQPDSTYVRLNLIPADRYKLTYGYYKDALEKFREMENKKGVALVYNNLGIFFMTLFKDHDSAAIEHKAGVTNSLDSSIHYLELATNIYHDLEDKLGLSVCFNSLGDCYFNKKKYPIAIDYFTKALQFSDSVGALQRSYEAHQGLAKSYKTLAISLINHKTKADYLLKSVEHHEQYVVLRDSVFNEEKQRDIGKLEASHEYEVADLRRKQEEKEQARIETEQRQRRNNLQYSVILIAILVLFGGVLSLGFINVSVRMAEGIIFFSFLILFEFLLVLADPYIDNWSGGAPGIKLLFNAGIAALIFPLHAFFESRLKGRLVKSSP